jgi:signal transduction histidine kinase
VIGVLEAINKHNGKFDENDSRLLQAISGPLAVAIENALLHSDVLAEKRRIEKLFSGMSEGVLTTTIDGTHRVANDALLSLLRLESDHLMDQPLVDIIKTQPISFADFYDEVLTTGEEFPQMACELCLHNGSTVPVLISGTTINQEEGMVGELIFVFSDLSLIREVERMRDDFFHNIVHELRTPLATILMYARLLREGKASGDPAKTGRFLGVIERESDRLQKMVRQMLLLAKLEANELRSSSESAFLAPILEQILPPLTDRALEKGLTFRSHIQSKLPAVAGGEDTLYMVFNNLIENSINFTPSGEVSIDAHLEGQKVRVDVIDNGIGIPKESINNLFQRFYRAQTAVERGIAGTGLGLYMVREGLDKFGGTISVQSEEGKGTAVTVYLPVTRT